MTAEKLSKSPTAASLEQLEQRHPQLANLLSLRSKREYKQKITRSEESEKILDHQSSEPLSLKEKQVMGKWLQSHYDRIEQKLSIAQLVYPKPI